MKQPPADSPVLSTASAGALSRAAVERRIIVRESEFWKNAVNGRSANIGTLSRGRAADLGRVYSFLHSRRNSRRIESLLDGFYGHVCLVKGESYLGVAQGPDGGSDFLLTNFRLIEWRVPSGEPGAIVPLEAVRSYEPAEGLIEYVGEDGALQILHAPGKIGNRDMFAEVPLGSALDARAWKSLDGVSRRILSRTRTDLIRELKFSPREIVRMVPAIRRGKLRFAHKTQAKIFGICAGVANRFCLPVVAVRTGFVILVPLFGVGLILYLVVGLAMAVVSTFVGDTRHSYEDADSAGCPIA
ncbi:MAG TPA: PspC domain-containing protein [Spirochaetia bacterium]|nr:PspC domain-containing protein [Spirochaetia bacterium]